MYHDPHNHPNGNTDSHTHADNHNHAHNHAHGPSATASVILEIGGTIGALILETDAEHLGQEIEISRIPRGDEPEPLQLPRTHSMVRARHTQPPTYHAVYPDLPEGEYTIWRDQDTPAGAVTITGGQITRYAF